jgi:hypothetical protein
MPAFFVYILPGETISYPIDNNAYCTVIVTVAVAVPPCPSLMV